MVKLTKREVLDIMSKNNDIIVTSTEILSKVNIDIANVSNEDLQRFKKSLATLKCKNLNKFENAKRMKDRYEAANSDWLNSDFCISISEIDVNNPKSPLKLGRPVIEFSEKSVRSQRREVAEISSKLQHDPQRMMMACRYASKRSGNIHLYFVLDEILKCPEQPQKIRKIINEPAVLIKKKTAQEALSFLLENSLSKTVYQNMRTEVKLCGADIWPTYNEVRLVKAECRPQKDTISISEKVAKVTLQSLLNHTTERIVKLQSEVIIQYMESTNLSVLESLMMFSWGFDGCTGVSNYNQSYTSTVDNAPQSDGNLFVTTVIPLRLLYNSDAKNIILWNNRTSQSPKSCRPLCIQCISESSDVILKQKNDTEEEINNLEILEITLEGKYCIRIHFAMFLTLIDGKVLNIITNTKSMQTCPICHATPSMFNNLSNKDKGVFLPDPKSLQYGLSPLHAWIKLFEVCLHISYRKDLKVWQVRNPKHKLKFAERKKYIQQILWEKLGLIVDKPKSGGSGTTNNGNTARRAFEDPNLLAELLALDVQMIRNFKKILIALSCHLPIDASKFDELCQSTAKIYVQNYNWYLMPSTLHKILMHGGDVIRTSVLPIGMLGEEASESRNKCYKSDRQHHARKISREANLQDVFYRSMDSTDPIINDISLQSRLKKRNKFWLAKEISDLLEVPEENSRSDSNTNDEDEQTDLSGISESFEYLQDIELSADEDNED